MSEKDEFIKGRTGIYMQSWRQNMLQALPKVIERFAWQQGEAEALEGAETIARVASSIAAHLVGEELSMAEVSAKRAAEEYEEFTRREPEIVVAKTH